MSAPATSSATSPSAPGAPVQPEVSAGSARLVALVVAILMVALLSLMIWGIGRRAAGSVGAVPVTARPAPAFTLPPFSGGQFDLAASEGKPIVINFWASSCIPCAEEAPALETSSREYRVTFIGVNVQDTEPLAREFLPRFGVTYPNGRDETGAIAVEYGMSGVPETYFVDRNGVFVRKWQGALGESRLRSFLDELLR